MRLVTFSIDDETLVGKTDGIGITKLTGRLSEPVPDMIALISAWGRLEAEVKSISTFEHSLRSVRLLAPVLRPGKIFGIGMNYADHVVEAGTEMPTSQIWFTKAATSVNNPYSPILRPRISTALDYEAELVIVIGKRCRYVDETEAKNAIFGYSVGNDVSVRDWQMRTSQFVLGKSFDTHAPYGPWISTGDEIDEKNLSIKCFVNGDLRQSSNTKNLIFNCAAQVSHLSQAMTLEPGDIIFTGTPGGVGAAMKPPQWLVPGDKVRVEIDGIGAIENMVEDDSDEFF